MSAVIHRVIQGVHMGMSHDGLAKLLKKEKIEAINLKPGELIMFLNNKGDKLKVLGGHGRVIGYLKMPKGQRIYKEALQWLPETFGASGFDYDKACRKEIETRLARRVSRRVSPLDAARMIKGDKKKSNYSVTVRG